LGLRAEPILKKFFANKIESSSLDWGDYLLEIADIFSSFDGEDFNRELINEKFSKISGRSQDAMRDASNFRDEFGAYGTYLGVFHLKIVNECRKIFLSNAAKHFLCSTEPNVEGFCRVQMALFQYPNGAGAANAQVDTVQEIKNGIRVNPLRLLCRLVVALHELRNVPLASIHISYQNIFMLINDNRINTNFSPDKEILVNVLDEYADDIPPLWVNKHLQKFKRNFHIFERTGLFSRDKNGLTILMDGSEKIYEYISAISQMTTNFNGFDECYGQFDITESIKKVVSSSAWGEYYDALTLPMQILFTLSNDINDVDIISTATPIGTISLTEQTFPEMRSFQANSPRTFVPNGNITDPYEIIIRREKANLEHARILNMLAAILRLKGYEVFENIFVDLFMSTSEQSFIFEIKSNNSRNTLSQIRKAIAQLYEYRYRIEYPQAILCIVLQQKPSQDWVIDYLLNDRNILICWLVDEVRLECPEQCYCTLANLGILE
jgi:hypothetical protein